MESPLELAGLVERPEPVPDLPDHPDPTPEELALAAQMDAVSLRDAVRLGLVPSTEVALVLFAGRELAVGLAEGRRTAWDVRVAMEELARVPAANLRLFDATTELPDDAAVPQRLLRLALSHRLVAGGGGQRRRANKIEKAKGAKAAEEVKKDAAQPKPAQVKVVAKRQATRETLAGRLEREVSAMADPGPDELIRTKDDMERLVAQAKSLFTAFVKVSKNAKATGVPDRNLFNKDVTMGHFYFNRELELLKNFASLTAEERVRLRKIQRLGRGMLLNLSLRSPFMISDELRLTLDDDTERNLDIRSMMYKMLKSLHGGREDEGYTAAEADRAFEAAARFVDGQSYPLAVAKLSELHYDDGQPLIQPSSNGPSAQPSTETMGDDDEPPAKTSRASKPSTGPSASPGPLSTCSREVFVAGATAFLKDQLEGKTIVQVERWFREALESGVTISVSDTGDFEQTRGQLLVKAERGKDSNGNLLPVRLINCGRTCFMNAAVQMMALLVADADVLAPPEPDLVPSEAWESEESRHAVVLAALHVHLSAAQSSAVQSLGLYLLALTLCLTRPGVYGDPARHERDSHEAFEDLADTVHRSFSDDRFLDAQPLNISLTTGFAYECPDDSCTTTSRAETFSLLRSHLVNLVELAAVKSVKEPLSLGLTELLTAAARTEKDWHQNCCCVVGVGKEQRHLRTGKIVSRITALPSRFLVRPARQIEGQGANQTLWTGRLTGLEGELDFSAAVSTTNTTAQPLHYVVRAVLLKAGGVAHGHYIIILVKGHRLILLDDDNILEKEGSIENWREAFPGRMEGFYEDVLLVEKQEREGGELGQSGAVSASADATPSTPSSSAATTPVLTATTPPLPTAPTSPAAKITEVTIGAESPDDATNAAHTHGPSIPDSPDSSSDTNYFLTRPANAPWVYGVMQSYREMEAMTREKGGFEDEHINNYRELEGDAIFLPKLIGTDFQPDTNYEREPMERLRGTADPAIHGVIILSACVDEEVDGTAEGPVEKSPLNLSAPDDEDSAITDPVPPAE